MDWAITVEMTMATEGPQLVVNTFHALTAMAHS